MYALARHRSPRIRFMRDCCETTRPRMVLLVATTNTANGKTSHFRIFGRWMNGGIDGRIQRKHWTYQLWMNIMSNTRRALLSSSCFCHFTPARDANDFFSSFFLHLRRINADSYIAFTDLGRVLQDKARNTLCSLQQGCAAHARCPLTPLHVKNQRESPHVCCAFWSSSLRLARFPTPLTFFSTKKNLLH